MRHYLFTAAVLLLFSEPSNAQYRNLEVGPNGTGGLMGTYGAQNFDIDTQSGEVQGHIGGTRPNLRQERPSRTRGNVGATQRRCYVDGNGVSFCR